MTCVLVVNSPFPLPLQPLFYYEKYIRFFTHNVFLFGKVFVVDLSIKLKNMTLLFSRYSEFGLFFSLQFWIPFTIGVVSFLLRGLPIFKQIWFIYKWVFIGLFLFYTATFVKNEVKSWWNND